MTGVSRWYVKTLGEMSLLQLFSNPGFDKHLFLKHRSKQWQIMTNHRLKRGKDPQHGIPPHKNVSSQVLCSSVLRQQDWKLRRGVPTLTHQKRTTWSSRRDTTRPVTWAKHGWDDRDTHGCKLKKNWDWKVHLSALLQGSSYHPSKIIWRGGIWKINKPWTLEPSLLADSFSLQTLSEASCKKYRKKKSPQVSK